MRNLLLFAIIFASFSIESFAQCAGENFIAPHRFRVGELLGKNVAADFNRDGKTDVAVLDSYSATVSILLGDGAGNLSQPSAYNVGLNPQDIAIGDFNGDGKNDLAVSDSNFSSVFVLNGNGDGSFQSPTGYGVGLSVSSLAAGDFNRDGKIDIAASNLGSGNVSLLFNSCEAKKIQRINFNKNLQFFQNK